jgi:hypothetical protein
MGVLICGLAIGDFRLISGDRANWQSAIAVADVGTHPLPQTVLTSLPLRGLSFRLHHYANGKLFGKNLAQF